MEGPWKLWAQNTSDASFSHPDTIFCGDGRSRLQPRTPLWWLL